jgi:CBS-domain-containing membrane protein
MSAPVITVAADADVEDCCRTMEQHQIRRVPVVDESGSCRGIVSQADIARTSSDKTTGKVLRELSRPSSMPSRIG